MPDYPDPIHSIEIYVRFATVEGVHGMFERPFESIEDAAQQFADDKDCVGAVKMGFSAAGRVIGMKDVTDAVRDTLLERCRNAEFDTCPHPIVSDEFDGILREIEREAEEDAEHERIERAMLNI